MQVAHGPAATAMGACRWPGCPRAGLERLGQVLVQGQFRLRGLYPAPYALPLGTAAMHDGYLLTRHSLHQTAVHPLGQQVLDQGLEVPLAPEAQRWSGAVPGWGLHGRPQPTGERWLGQGAGRCRPGHCRLDPGA